MQKLISRLEMLQNINDVNKYIRVILLGEELIPLKTQAREI
jgi:hypothetical protein